MPSPIGHSLIGYAIYKVATKRTQTNPPTLAAAVYLFAANAADLDFIPGLLIDAPNRYHHWISHSIGAAVLFALLTGFVLSLLKKITSRVSLTSLFTLYFSHICLDYWSIDTGYPYGEPLFWPFSYDYYIAGSPFLVDIHRDSFSDTFVESLFSLHNLWAVGVELLLFIPVVLLVLAFQSK